ncbi:nicotinate-nucleotide--dimethylbenzimidazole phosphoribosyltransferase [Sphaerochaeta pleomorpha str. Grapes]|uniref:Nicotinate-nucleotide--dimethylbenzimidazole phosphoribosyltransferase n=1 Tax=Sphaerochaeta pleomorpha (strain ATCC BAA-1885 / DSM 22778 / Grapes) TaxID=158190 RepID=G8QSJ9_SPHPG|nr:nicotinate-nucleotide--dimethylbenzimidazole phosphoribosyltransferase [Sphaerochaeta pleomorpha]AEV28960.1 nicotinate-nucleotide--dimethylbenzimidazole phosphoribosyltransferase [Sphaerochaeta pleomorpha str. Grapes]
MSVPPVDRNKKELYVAQLLGKAMPPHSLGVLAELAVKLALINPKPLRKPALILFAGDHGIAEEAVTHSPQEITWQQCVNFAHGGGACSLFARCNAVELTVVDVGVDHVFTQEDLVLDQKVSFGTKNFLKEPAMTQAQCTQAMEKGRILVREKRQAGFDVIAFGEMGVANTTSASALASALTGYAPFEVTGKGSGISEAELLHKQEVIEKAIARYPTDDALELLACLGGFELAAIAGGILEACELGLPVLLDGFITTAAALVSCALEPNCKSYLIPCHVSGMHGHSLLLHYLGLDSPILDLGMQLGEGTGSLVAWPIVALASRILPEMTSFSEGKVTDSTEILSRIGLV